MENTRLNVVDLAARIHAGEIEVTPADTDLSVEALADPSGPDCYPDTTIDFRAGDHVVVSVGCWILGCYHRGPNRRDNGAWIGHGWVWQEDESDGATTGRPRPRHRIENGTVTYRESAGSLAALALDVPCDEDGDHTPEALEAIETIQDAIDAAYAEISVSPADDDAVAIALQLRRPDETLEACGESIDLYAGLDAGRVVYTHDDAETVWEDATKCAESAGEVLRTRLEAAIEGLAQRVTEAAEMLDRAGQKEVARG